MIPLIVRPGLHVRGGTPWLALVLFAVVAGLIYHAYFRSRPPVSRARGRALALLRLGSLLALVLLILEPTLTLSSRVPEKPRVAVLVDTSRSMRFADRAPSDSGGLTEPTTRIEQAADVLWGPEERLAARLEHLADVRVFRFAEGVVYLGNERPRDDELAGTGGDQTNLGLALETAADWESAGRPDAIVVLSDGQSNVGPDPVLLAGRLGIPIHAVAVGDPRPPRDVALVRCVTNEVAYVESRVEVRVDLTATGMDVPSVPVTLSEGDSRLDSTSVAVGPGGDTRQASLFFTPTQEGVHRYRVEIPVQEGEARAENNHRLLVVSVLKSKMRVYYAEAYPSWDYAFLRRVLERDPNVELTARVLAGSGAALPDPSAMSQYDVFILGNLSRRNFTSEAAERLVRAVTEDGRGVVWVGGRNALDFTGSPIDAVMPLEAGSGRGRHLVDSFQPVLTPEGSTHPITRLDPDPEENRKTWTDLPPLTAMNVLGKPKPGAERLLVHPTRNEAGEPLAVLTAHRVGAGKCAVVSAYTLWRWSFLTAAFGSGEDPYARFWSNMVRWLVSREDLKRVRVATDRPVYRSGERVVLRVQVYDEAFRPVEGATVVATLSGAPPGAAGTPEQRLVLDPVGSAIGHYEGEIRFLPPGNYRVLVDASKGGQGLGRDETDLAVDTYSLEHERTAMDEGLLRQVARASHGSYRTAREAGALPDALTLERRWVDHVVELHLSHRWVLFFCLCGFLFLEWLLRKRSGMA